MTDDRDQLRQLGETARHDPLTGWAIKVVDGEVTAESDDVEVCGPSVKPV